MFEQILKNLGQVVPRRSHYFLPEVLKIGASCPKLEFAQIQMLFHEVNMTLKQRGSQ